MRFNVYVDGFNLYYGALRGRPYRWLDIRRFARTLLGPSDEVHRVRYFTSRIRPSRSDPEAYERQATYLRALQTLPDLSIHYGHFLISRVTMERADGAGSVPVIKTEEKGTDVNLATHLLLDAFDGDYEGALIVSNDSDLAEPIRQVQARFDRPVGVVLPILNHSGIGRRRVPSRELTVAATFDRRITNTRRRLRLLAACQFPETLTDARGSFTRPREWA